MTINFRPHHVLCAICYKGKGYSPAFVANFDQLITQLNAEPHGPLTITMVAQTDSICSPCPHRINTQCETEEKIAVLDHAHAQALHLKPGDTFTWEEAKNLVKKNLSMESFHQICASCSWKTAGICEQVLSDFLVK